VYNVGAQNANTEFGSVVFSYQQARSTESESVSWDEISKTTQNDRRGNRKSYRPVDRQRRVCSVSPFTI